LRSADRAFVLRWCAGAIGIFALLALPWPGSAQGFARGYGALANAIVFAPAHFGPVGRARLAPLTEDIVAGESAGAGLQGVVPDAVLALRVDGHTGELRFGVSLRRDAHLVLAVLFAVILAAPLGWRRRARALAVGVPVVLLLTLACQWLGAACLFASRLRTIYPLGPTMQALLDTSYEALLLPPANRFVVPLIVGLASCWWQRGHDNDRAASPTVRANVPA
jgi:hypothetical protein